ncbi:hypothetical protein lerEdw1_001828 [Lerista edwardsae]|nr:hypothetical protein lerEdw1_001828 [Lerista edwardsae]
MRTRILSLIHRIDKTMLASLKIKQLQEALSMMGNVCRQGWVDEWRTPIYEAGKPLIGCQLSPVKLWAGMSPDASWDSCAASGIDIVTSCRPAASELTNESNKIPGSGRWLHISLFDRNLILSDSWKL